VAVNSASNGEGGVLMKNKIKKFAYSIGAVALAAPALVLAQFEKPGGTNLPENTLTQIVSNLMKWILGIVGFIGVIGFAIAGILYLTAAGDEDRIDVAKKAMIYSIVGVIVALLGLVILAAAERLLSGSNPNF